jgi:hypothetical protein
LNQFNVEQTIKGPHVIQINKIRDISQPNCQEIEEEKSSTKFRTLMFEFTDGKQKFKGIEYRNIASLSSKSPIGLKVQLEFLSKSFRLLLKIFW